jgi:hypothetical protein
MSRHGVLWFLILAGFPVTERDGGLSCCVAQTAGDGAGNESIWLEAEHFSGIEGYCWPMGDEARGMQVTNGHWGLSGPGWAAEWNQGGESGFMSVAAGAGESRAVLTRRIEVPRTGQYQLWVRYSDWREQSEKFDVVVQQDGRPDQRRTFGGATRVDDDNEMKLYWGWAFAWDMATVDLISDSAVILLEANQVQPVPRQIDVLVLTSDVNFHPLTKERPDEASRRLLEQIQQNGMDDWPPLARRNLWRELDGSSAPESDPEPGDWHPPAAWQPRTFHDRGFLYLWNVSHVDPLTSWLGDDPKRVRFPYNIIDADTRKEFETLFGGKDEVPIFSDPRIVPTFHTVGGGVFATEPGQGKVKPLGEAFARWLDQNPDRCWATMMNYHPGEKVGPPGVELFRKYRDRYVGSIAGESLGYFYPDAEEMKKATASARTRRQLVAAFEPLSLARNAAKYREIYDRDLDENPFAEVISCHSVGSMAFAPLCYHWGATTVGYESAASTSSLLGLRLACQRGAARQYGGMYATYRSCNFGDASTIFSKESSFSSPKNILDNYYSVYSGAGMTWYKFDLWYQYMAGSSMFYHEQGFDEFWKPGGTTAAGNKPVQLSPKGKLVERFLRITRQHPDRGAPVTPVAFLLDYAHGWEPASFWPNSFVNWQHQPDRFLHSDHEQMLEQWLWAACFPIVAESEKPITAVSEVFVPGIFGDIFDCIFADPDLKRWPEIDRYPVVIAVGDLEISDAEARRLRDYVEQGGTLVISAGQIPESAGRQLGMPSSAEASQRASSCRWHWQAGAPIEMDCPVFEYHPIPCGDSGSGEVWNPLATTGDGNCFCAFRDIGGGRLVALSVPRGLTVSGSLHPAAVRILAQLTRSQLPIEVDGDVEWLLNRTAGSWLLTLINPAGQAKPQQGITPTDYRQNREIVIKSLFPLHAVSDWLSPEETFSVDGSEARRMEITVPAGSVRILEIQ